MTVTLPDYLQPFRKKAEEYIAKGCVQDIEFSGSTYQVKIIEPDSAQEAWAFLQLDNRGNIKDCFCSCEREELSYCPHIAAAFLQIYHNHSQPLHHRFQRSLWNHLCRLCSDQLGDSSDLLKKVGRGHYSCSTPSHKNVFFIKGKTKEILTRLNSIMEQRQRETEETSLKFSNLSQEEIALWREGRPSADLRYQLSFWNDLAHWFMELQEAGDPYTISFKYGEKFPNYITITFSQLEAGFYLSQDNLPVIIPSLDTVNSPLIIHHASQDAIESIEYDKKESSFKLILKSHEQIYADFTEKAGEVIDGWWYVPKDGFYAKDQHYLLAGAELKGTQVSEMLNEQFTLIKEKLKGTSLHNTPIDISYLLQFDSEWNLHIVGYVVTPGDLTTGDAKYFGDWAYLDDKGFYPISEAHFDNVEKTIPCKAVSDFIKQERSWLNTQAGFHVHLKSIEAQLTYQVSADNRLSFHRLLATTEIDSQSKDFGSWVYIAEKGFYPKVSAHTGLPLHGDIVINAGQVPLFIRMNRNELQLISHFFSEKSPVAKAGLNIMRTKQNTIDISPEYTLHEEYMNKKVIFFDEYTYVPGEGFHELPPSCRLPERYHHQVNITTEQLPSFFIEELPALKPYIKVVDPSLTPPEQIQLCATSISRSEQAGWYDIKLSYKTERGFVPLSDVWGMIKKKHHFLFSDAGRLDLTDKRFDWIKALPKQRFDKKHNLLQLPTMELMRLQALEQLEIAAKGSIEATSKELLEELTQLQLAEEPDISSLAISLRPYQFLGVRWLWFLYTHGLSGLLCDDMGLGKTHQSMALMASILSKRKKELNLPPLHFLIVCPTSVIFHWQEKLQASLPHLRVLIFYGYDRNRADLEGEYDIILTSYGIWRIEHEVLKKIPFELAIFDEIQIAKNQNSRIHATLLEGVAQMRLGLTGTPIENHLRELKSLFDIVLPSYMPGETDYREVFVKPIERDNSAERRALLSRLIKPFILRRRKEEVLLDLPEKTEEIAHCLLSQDQQMLYTDVLHRSRERVLDQLQDKSNPVPYIHIFAILSGLKQICNHPAAFLKQPERYEEFSSGKWDLFVELLNEARDSGQKVVIFTQYLAMLDIFQLYLNEIGVGFSTIRGATLDRGEQVRRFNHDPTCEVFLGSLQAAGLGVDLTAGSVVIHYDRWWNAARENQATDRVHRIGQTRGVQVFKLVTKGTFEERIDALIVRKGRMMEEVVGIDDHRFMKQFDREDLLQLLQDVSDLS